MANEIIGVGSVLANGRTETQMLYVFPIVPRVKDASNADVVPAFDPARIPAFLKSRLTTAQLNAITAGDAGYVSTALSKSGGETDGQFAARTRLDYDALTTYYLQQRRDEAVESNTFDLRRFAINR